jgi:hypothetical protein
MQLFVKARVSPSRRDLDLRRTNITEVSIMRLALICAASLAFCAGAALADEVTVPHKDTPPPGAVIEHRAADVDVHKKVVTHEDGCATKTVKKTNGEGDTMTKTKSNC